MSSVEKSPRVICHVSYELDPQGIDVFEDYARSWTKLIERHGGTHLGFYVATAPPTSAPFSFPGLGRSGPTNSGFALFSFPDAEAYERYRHEVVQDPECQAAERIFKDSKCFVSYERTFLRQIT